MCICMLVATKYIQLIGDVIISASEHCRSLCFHDQGGASAWDNSVSSSKFGAVTRGAKLSLQIISCIAQDINVRVSCNSDSLSVSCNSDSPKLSELQIYGCLSCK